MASIDLSCPETGAYSSTEDTSLGRGNRWGGIQWGPQSVAPSHTCPLQVASRISTLAPHGGQAGAGSAGATEGSCIQQEEGRGRRTDHGGKAELGLPSTLALALRSLPGLAQELPWRSSEGPGSRRRAPGGGGLWMPGANSPHSHRSCGQPRRRSQVGTKPAPRSAPCSTHLGCAFEPSSPCCAGRRCHFTLPAVGKTEAGAAAYQGWGHRLEMSLEWPLAQGPCCL